MDGMSCLDSAQFWIDDSSLYDYILLNGMDLLFILVFLCTEPVDRWRGGKLSMQRKPPRLLSRKCHIQKPDSQAPDKN